MGLYWIQKRSSSANLRLRLSVFQQSQIHKIHLILSSSALPWFHTGRVRISVVQLISLHCLHRMKTFPMQKVGKLIPNKVPDQHWQVISVDMIRELPDSKGDNAILMEVDHMSKQIHAIPTVTSLDSARVAQLFLEHIWHHHGLPEEVISNHRSAFISNFSCKLAALLGVKLTPSPSYHLQTDGQTEHMNQEIEAYLQVFVSH